MEITDLGSLRGKTYLKYLSLMHQSAFVAELSSANLLRDTCWKAASSLSVPVNGNQSVLGIISFTERKDVTLSILSELNEFTIKGQELQCMWLSRGWRRWK